MLCPDVLTQGGDGAGGTGIPEGEWKGKLWGPRSCLLCSVLMALEKEEEESPSSSEEEEEEEVPDVALDSDMEQVSGRNLATCSDQASAHPLNTHPHMP